MFQPHSELSQPHPPASHIKTHTELQQILEDVAPTIKPTDIYFRPLEHQWEAEELKFLDKECFPDMPFPDEFYDKLLDNYRVLALLVLYDVKYQSQKKTLILGCVMFEYRRIDPNISYCLDRHYSRKKLWSLYKKHRNS